MMTWFPVPRLPVKKPEHQLVLVELAKALIAGDQISVNQIAKSCSVHYSTVKKPVKKEATNPEAHNQAEQFRDAYPRVGEAKWNWTDGIFKLCIGRFEKGGRAASEFSSFMGATRHYIELLETRQMDPKFQFQPHYWIHKERKGEDAGKHPPDTWTEYLQPAKPKRCRRCGGTGKTRTHTAPPRALRCPVCNGSGKDEPQG